jgi:hypothetical protein
MGCFMTVLLPKLLRASFRAWVLLSERLEEARLCPDNMRKDTVGLLGYAVCSLARTGPYTVRIVVTALDGADEGALEAPRARAHCNFRSKKSPASFRVPSFWACKQVVRKRTHSYGLFSPAPATSSSSTSLLVQVFGGVLRYMREVVPVYKLGGRELLMRRVPPYSRGTYQCSICARN